MHNPAFVLENDRHKLLWDFEIQTDHVISARRPDLVIIHTHTHTHTHSKRELAELWTLVSRLTT